MERIRVEALQDDICRRCCCYRGVSSASNQGKDHVYAFLDTV